jgi:5-methylcytosine-specific restriction endonuclease McrA
MPANPSLYPPDWPQIALRIKEAVDWVCQDCGKQCRRPGEPGSQRDMLTVHHIDHIPANCADDNLIALCSGCHLRADAQHHAKNAKRTRARRAGQMWLSEEMEAI